VLVSARLRLLLASLRCLSHAHAQHGAQPVCPRYAQGRIIAKVLPAVTQAQRLGLAYARVAAQRTGGDSQPSSSLLSVPVTHGAQAPGARRQGSP
jgi:hypothetical protein